MIWSRSSEKNTIDSFMGQSAQFPGARSSGHAYVGLCEEHAA